MGQSSLNPIYQSCLSEPIFYLYPFIILFSCIYVHLYVQQQLYVAKKTKVVLKQSLLLLLQRLHVHM